MAQLTVGEKRSADPIPAKKHPARCIGIFAIGKQYNPRFKHWRDKILFMFELPGVRAQFEVDGVPIDRPRLASRMYGMTWSDRGHLKPMIEDWRGEAYEVGDVIKFKDYLTKPAMLRIAHNKDGDKTYSNIASVNELEDEKAPKQETPEMYFSFDEHDNFESVETALDELPEWVGWIVDKIRASQEYANMKEKHELGETEVPEDDADVPF